jgi:hypothetical protein
MAILRETFNANVLNKVLSHPAVKADQKTTLRRYLSASKDAGDGRRVVNVSYDYGKKYKKAKIGRMYAQLPTSLQGMKSQIRNAIAGEYYWDLDMVNAQPALLRQIATKHGWSAPLLEHYCDNREAVLAEVATHYAVGRSEAKDLFVRLLYLGTEERWKTHDEDEPRDTPITAPVLPRVTALARELNTLAQLMATEYADIRRTANKVNGRAKDDMSKDALKATMSLVLQTEEHKCLSAAAGALGDLGRPLSTLIFDGGLVERLAGETECPAGLISAVETAVLATTGWNTRWISKPMVVDPAELDLDDDDLIVEDTAEVATTGIIDDLHAARELVKLLGTGIARDGDTLFIFNDKTGMWDANNAKGEALMSAVVRFADRLVFVSNETDAKGNTKTKTHNYGGEMAKISAMLKLVPVLIPDTRFVERNGDSAKGKLLFADGIYDFATGTFTAGFDTSLVFFARIERNFTARSAVDEAIFAEVRDALFVKPFTSADDPTNDMGRFYREYLARSVAGEYHHKKILLGAGNRNTGKGVTTDAMAETFKGYVSTFNANNLLTTKVTKDESQLLMWLKPLRLSRVMMANEVDIDEKRPLNGNLINRLAGGGDTITFRGMREEDTKIRWRTNVVVLANDMPAISPINEGVLERVRNMRWTKSFKHVTDDSELGPNELRADSKWRGPHSVFIHDQRYVDAFFWVIAETYIATVGQPFFDPPIVAAETKEWVGEAGSAKVKEALETDYVITKNTADVVPYEDIKTHLLDAGITGYSDTKLGRELTALGLVKVNHRFGAKVQSARTGIRERREEDYDPDTIHHVPGGDY